jgi:putative restriction endonuclease
MPEPFQDFEIGKRYDLHREMWPASQGFGSYFTGIAPKGRHPKTTGVVILARLGERTRHGDAPRYGNRLDGDVLVFSGEDRRGHANARTIAQSPTSGFNRVLAESSERGVPIYCFCSKETDEKWEYLGLGEVGQWSLEPRGGRSIVEFRISLLGVPNAAAESALRAEIDREVTSADPPSLKSGDTRRTTSGSRKIRSQVFSRRVRTAYGNRCGVCGVERRSAKGWPEVDGAHIYPVELDGADDIRNGLALCKLHHWAFDGGLFAIDSKLVVRVLDSGRGIPGVSELDSHGLSALPADPDARPHELYLKERFKLSMAGWTRGKPDSES